MVKADVVVMIIVVIAPHHLPLRHSDMQPFQQIAHLHSFCHGVVGYNSRKCLVVLVRLTFCRKTMAISDTTARRLHCDVYNAALFHFMAGRIYSQKGVFTLSR